MKKGLAMLLAVALLVGLFCAPASAARNGVDDPSSNTNVSVNVTMDVNMEHKYYVDIDFPSTLVFTYTSNREWDPEDYEYVEAKGDAQVPNGWSDPQSFRITNHSDLPINYAVSPVVSNAAFGDLDIVVENGAGTIPACTVGTQDGAMNAVFSIGVAGIPTDALKGQQVTLGQVTIAITKV